MADNGSASLDPGDRAGAAFDRVGRRAWRLALWIVGDENLASEALVAAFAGPVDGSGSPRSDAALLEDVRRRASEAAAGRGSADSDGPSRRVLGALWLLSETQRAVLDLALVACLTTGQIADVIAIPRAEVHALLSQSLRALAPVCRSSAEPQPDHRRVGAVVGEAVVAAATAIDDLGGGTATAQP